MANIRNSISMVDRMTPTFRSILKAMDSTLRVMRNLDKQSNKGVQSKAYKRAEKDIKRANNELVRMRNYTQMANNAAMAGERAYSRMGTAVTRAGGGFSNLANSSSMFLQSLASGVYLAQRIANIIEGVMTTSDTARSQVARLGLYNTSEYSNEELYGQVFTTSMDSRSSLTGTADLANKILISGVYSGEGAAQASISTSGLINKALVAGGGTSEENERALRQLTQGLASGVLQGDELRSIREQTPYFAQVLAEGLSKIDERFEGIGIGDLKALGAEGELTSDRIIKAMWAMQDEIESDFKSMPKTFGQAITSLSSIWQYFLWMLSGADGPLGKINDRLWQFVSYLQSPQGLELLDIVAVGINFVATAISGLLGAAGKLVVFLQENVPIAQALFVALGAAAVASGVASFASWIAATWPILLIIGLVGLVAWAFLDAGYTAQEVAGAIVGGVLWVVAVIWDALVVIAAVVMWAVIAVMEIVMGAAWLIIAIVQGICQIVLWVITTIWSAIVIIWDVIVTIVKGAWGIIKGAIVAVYALFVGLGECVLGILYGIASAIDWVFGSNLADTVGGWMDGLGKSVDDLYNAMDPLGEFEDIGTTWTTDMQMLGDMYAGNGEYDDWNITDNMGATKDAFFGAMGGVWEWGLDTGSMMDGAIVDPGAWYDSGNKFGSGVVDEIGSLGLSIPDSSVLGQFNADGVEISGGYLDGIKSDVDIGDEDIQLLRDMAARDYLLQLQTITPVANVTFGDVKETADVNKIIEVIENMVEEQMATALVS